MKVIITGRGLKRLYDLRGQDEKMAVCSTNRGSRKGVAMECTRLVYLIKCSFCLSEFEGTKRAKFCSESCKQKNKRAQPKKFKQVELF